MATRIPFEAIRARALAVFPTLCARWLGHNGRPRGGRWIGAVNPTRCDRKPGSFTVNLRLGYWKDFATGDGGGDPISLYAYLRGCSQGEAARDLAAELGLDLGQAPRRWKPAPLRVPDGHAPDPDREAAQKRAIARSWWKKAKPAHGTLAEAYLRRRGITIPVPPSLRFSLMRHPASGGELLPCMVGAMQVEDGLVGVHRTFVAPDGSGKVKLPELDRRGRLVGHAPAKLMYGTAWGAVVRLGELGPSLALAEGIETALSVAQLAPGWTVWAGLSAGNLPRIAIPETVERLVIVADGDEKPDWRAELTRNRERTMRREGLEQAELAVKALRGLGIATSIIVPITNGDANDMLLGHPELARTFAGLMAGKLLENTDEAEA